jgi:hypothetical protein
VVVPGRGDDGPAVRHEVMTPVTGPEEQRAHGEQQRERRRAPLQPPKTTHSKEKTTDSRVGRENPGRTVNGKTGPVNGKNQGPELVSEFRPLAFSSGDRI